MRPYLLLVLTLCTACSELARVDRSDIPNGTPDAARPVTPMDASQVPLDAAPADAASDAGSDALVADAAD